MQIDKIQQIIFDALDVANQTLNQGDQIFISADTKLYGQDGQLESMGLVALLIDIEEALLDEDVVVSLSDERAMSMTNSPFRDVPALVGYIEQLIKEKK